MATSSIFTTIRIESPAIIKEFVDSYEAYEKSSAYSAAKAPSHVISTSEEIKKIFKNRFTQKK